MEHEVDHSSAELQQQSYTDNTGAHVSTIVTNTIQHWPTQHITFAPYWYI